MGLTNVQNGIMEEDLFDPSLLRAIDWDSRKSSFRNGVSNLNPGESLSLRPLRLSDYEKDYMTLLSELTSIGHVSDELFTERFKSMKRSIGTYYTVVIEDLDKSVIIGSATLVVEQKFIHSCAARGRIEDVVMNSDYRGKQLGKLLLEVLTLLGKHLGCYKMSLECTDDKVKFYQTAGYERDGQNFMVQRFKD